MKTATITINEYEPGDVLDISEMEAMYHKPNLDKGKKAVVISAIRLKSGASSYRVVTNDAVTLRLKAEEMGKEKYIGHIDLSFLLEDNEC